ncbi:MAG: hypothetical protein U1E91_06410 [Moraxella sp.]
MDLHTERKLDDVKQMFKDWTTYAANLTQGKNIKAYEKEPVCATD